MLLQLPHLALKLIVLKGYLTGPTMDPNLNQLILATEYDPRSKSWVDDILRSYRQEFDYYKESNKTSYDLIIYRAREQLKLSEETIEFSTKVIEDINKKEKTTEKDELLIKVHRQIIYNALNTIDTTKNSLIDYEWDACLEKIVRRMLKALEYKYSQDNDLEYLQKGATWVRSYSRKARSTPIAEEEIKEDLSAW